MIVSFSKNFLFLKSPKTASTSIEEALSWSCDPLVDIVTIDKASGRPGFNTRKNQLFNHITPQMLFDKKVLTLSQFESMNKIATVRNPWEVQVSRWWMHVDKVETDPAKSYKGLSIEEIESRYQQDFRQWLIDYFPTDRGYLVNEDVYYFYPSGKYMLQYVIRYENLWQDFQKVSKILKLNKVDKLPRFHSQHRKMPDHYREYYTSETRDLIAYHYQRHIEQFGYKF